VGVLDDQPGLVEVLGVDQLVGVLVVGQLEGVLDDQPGLMGVLDN